MNLLTSIYLDASVPVLWNVASYIILPHVIRKRFAFPNFRFVFLKRVWFGPFSLFIILSFFSIFSWLKKIKSLILNNQEFFTQIPHIFKKKIPK